MALGLGQSCIMPSVATIAGKQQLATGSDVAAHCIAPLFLWCCLVNTAFNLPGLVT